VANEAELEFYATPGAMTDLARCSSEAFEGLPESPDELMRVVRRCVVAGDAPEGRDDPQIRLAADMVERILEIEPGPLAEARPADKRFVGTCRHFATLTCALLRRVGVPSRVRAGFAGYFEPEWWVDHWIVEHWRDDRWVRVDAQYGDRFFQSQDPSATSESVVRDSFLSGGETWLRCRRGELDPDRCKMGFVNTGIGEVRGSVLYDVAALNQREMLPWDVWGDMKAAYAGETDESYDEMLDAISAVTTTGDFERIRAVYESRGNVRVPESLVA
jgi:hypothetical protein